MANPTHDINELKRRMQGAIQLLKQELGGLRTGRASPSLLEPVQVEAYGTHMPLNQLATVSVPEPRLLSVQVWDRSMVHAVEKATMSAWRPRCRRRPIRPSAKSISRSLPRKKR